MKTSIAITLCCFLITSCRRDGGSSGAAAEVVALDADTETCSACGMVVRDQPAPRGQVVRRDGTREFLCSIDDLVQYLNIPSPSGKPQKVYAEVMPDGHELADMEKAWQPWSEADDLYFVVGIERGGVMGSPALTYRTEAAAAEAAKNFGGRVVKFGELGREAGP